MLLRRLGASGRFEVLDSSDAEWLLGLAAVEGRETEVTWAILGSSKLYAGLVKLNTSNTIVCYCYSHSATSTLYCDLMS